MTDDMHWMSIDAVKPWDRNPRHNDKAAKKLATELRALAPDGDYRRVWTSPIAVQAGTMRIIAGHTRVKAARIVGMTEVPVKVLEVDDTEAKRLTLADNRIGEEAEWDDEILAALLAEDANPLDLGFDDAEIRKLLGRDEKKGDDVIPEPPKGPADSVVGAVYELGPHRLACGDSTKPETWAALGTDAADLVFTDPPYNVGAGMSEGFYANTDSPQMKALAGAGWDKAFSITELLGLLALRLAPDVTVYVCTSQHLAGEIWAWMSGWSSFHSYVVWCKPTPMPSLAKRHWTWATELICYATRGRHVFHFPESGHALSYWEIQTRDGAREHPTQKPIPLAVHAITHSSNVGAIVLDPFGGSGTTLIACAETGRVARLIELDPKYCDVIRRRWTRYAVGAGIDPGPGALE